MLESELSFVARRTSLTGHSIQVQVQSIQGHDDASSNAPRPTSHADHTQHSLPLLHHVTLTITIDTI
jgi:hypothetical protein